MVYKEADENTSPFKGFYQLHTLLKIAEVENSMTQQVEHFQSRLVKGGLAQISSGGSQTWFALKTLTHSLQNYHGDPPLSLWISDVGVLYPEALHHYWKIPLSRFLQVKVPTSAEVWSVAVESAQTGLFAWIFLRTDRGGHPTEMRRLQLAAEKNTTKVLILGKVALPHWTLKCHLKG